MRCNNRSGRGPGSSGTEAWICAWKLATERSLPLPWHLGYGILALALHSSSHIILYFFLTQSPAGLQMYWDEKNQVVKLTLLKSAETKERRKILPRKRNIPPKQLYYGKMHQPHCSGWQPLKT